MTPTARALALVVPIKEALALMVRAVSPAQFEPGRAQDMFTIAATDFAEYVLLPKLLARLAQVAPLVRLQLRSWPHHRVPPFLQAGEVDVALGFFDETPAGHHKLPLFDDHFVGVISKHHSQVASRLTLARYLKLKHIIVTADPHARGVIDDVLLNQGKQREIGLRLSHFLMVPPVVAATEMVAALSYRVAEPMQAHLALHVFPLPLEVPRGKVSLVWHERTSDAPAQKWFRSQIKLVSEQV